MPGRAQGSPPRARVRGGSGLYLVATGGGVGQFPLGQGSLASLLAAAACYPLLLLLDWPLYVGAALALSAVAVYTAGRVAADLGEPDPAEVVIDEAAGMWVAAIALPPDLYNLAAVFLLFRLFDVVKPAPIPLLERLSGGWGIAADDVAAGLLARAAWWLLQANFDFL